MEIVLISFLIGVSFYFVIVYIIELFQFFNIFSAYLSFIIIDVIILFYFYKKGLLVKRIRQGLDFVRSKDIRMYSFLIIFSIVLLFQFLKFWYKITRNSSLPASDPYLWVSCVMYLFEHGHMYEKCIGITYPLGFTYFNAGAALISPNITTVYFFMKIACMPLLTFYLIALYSISNRIFKKTYVTYIILLSTLSYSLFLQRTIMYLPSTLSMFLILISIIILITKMPNYMISFSIFSSFIIHPLTTEFFLFLLISYYIIKFLTERENFRDLLKEILLLLGITALLSITFFLHMYLYFGVSIWDFFMTIIEVLQRYDINFQVITTQNHYLLSIFQFPDIVLEFISYDKLERLFFKRTLGYFLLISILGLVVRPKHIKEQYKDILTFSKLGLILMFTIYYFPYLFHLNFITNFYYYEHFYLRVVETYFPYVLLMVGFAIEYIVNYSKLLWDKWESREKFRKLLSKHAIIKKYFRLDLCLIYLFVAASTLNCYDRWNFYHKYNNIYFNENMLYILENVPKGATIAVRDFRYDNDDLTENRVYRILTDYNIVYYNCTKDINYDEFYNFTKEHEVDYIILKRSCFNESIFLDEFDKANNFELVFEPLPDRDWLFSVYKFNP
ncbi:MAG: hypothetical protein ACTSR8_05050 [Promethearchaeota archaeon]